MQQEQQLLLVAGYVRRNHHDHIVPSDVVNIVYQFYLVLIESSILMAAESMQLMNLLHEELTKRKVKEAMTGMDIELLYRASEHEFDSDKFHGLCDAKGATITLFHTEFDHVFGGYASKSWNKNEQRIADPTAFLFNARPFVKVHALKETEAEGIEALWNYEGFGPIYGKGNDIWIPHGTKKCNKDRLSGAKPNSFSFDQKELSGATELDGFQAARFAVNDYEVFSVKIIQ